MPHVISDIMEPVEQVDGRHYTSKRAFRAVGRANGLTEVGNEKFRPRVRGANVSASRQQRRDSIRNAVEKFKAGIRPKETP